MDRYDRMREFIKENFETTSNKWDRLHTEDVMIYYTEKEVFYIAQGRQHKFSRVWE